jgi:hypothetical protein
MCARELRFMAGSNSRDGPFLTYLTVFQSRLGATNLVLAATGHAFVPQVALERQLKRVLSERREVDLAETRHRPLLDYLVGKKLLSKGQSAKGRYSDWSLSQGYDGPVITHRGQVRATLSAFVTDVQLADERVRSTVGVPTADNVSEIVGLAHQLRLITRSKNTWTAAGHTTSALRSYTEERTGIASNPFVLGAESVALLRQIIGQDWLLLSELLDVVVNGAETFSRDDIASELPDCAQRAYKRAKLLKLSPAALAEARQFADLLRKTAQTRQNASTGPGVLEHRTAPRLEWLVELGALSKDGLAANGFQYRQCPDLRLLRDLCRESMPAENGAEEASLRYWQLSDLMRPMRTAIEGGLEGSAALIDGFRRVRRSVGPAPIREVAFVSLVCNPTSLPSMQAAVEYVVDWALAAKGVTLSGGKFSRTPEFIHLTESIYEEKGAADR